MKRTFSQRTICQRTMLPRTIALSALFAGALMGADGGKMTVAKLYDSELASAESEIVPLAEAMPADKYNFAPTGGALTGVRTFAQQVKHLAAVIYLVGAAAKQEKPPVNLQGENGPDSVASKEQIVQFLKDAFAYGHNVMATLTEKNQLDSVKSPFGGGEMVRGSLAALATSHSFDHYGQMVIYARMNNVVPPASR
jgi:hypothetical protein